MCVCVCVLVNLRVNAHHSPTMQVEDTPEVICCGLSCMDVELGNCTVPATRESVVPFNGTTSRAGGSAPQTAYALARLRMRPHVVTTVGTDARGHELVNLCTSGGRVHVHATKTNNANTAVAFLPLFKDGTRACFVDLGANLVITAQTLLPETLSLHALRVFHFGYPHLMPRLQGAQLRSLFDQVRQAAPYALITLDINGADAPEHKRPVLAHALPVVAAIHANVDEACVVSSLFDPHRASQLRAVDIRDLASWFTDRGCGIALVTCGRNGVFAGTGTNFAYRVRLSPGVEQNAFVYESAFAISNSHKVNASGAGDAFCAGVIAQLAKSRGESGLVRIAHAGLASANFRIDPSKSADAETDLDELLDRLRSGPRIQPDCNLGFKQGERLG